MGVINAPWDKNGLSADDAPLVRLCHDLRQYVAAGLLLSEQSSATIDEAAVLGRMSLIRQQFAAIAELLEVEQDARRIGGVNLSRLAGECADVVRVTHRAAVIFERPARVTVVGDQALLRRAIGNLLDNACRAAGGAGTVQVHVDIVDGEAWVEVSDDGPGFGDVASGTGLGLRVVAEAVRACAGRMEIRSTPGAGTTVRICLPAGHRPVRSA
ncbi:MULTISPECIES: sensor histidine kinase KdpD [Kribbella]|jgi:signal transduction histidine kinase|uniref:histidine kinase n=1 Tax=Kribbella pratensis TaxID=2512112 RepID=A0ABY2FQN3_9ACTN|nr:MULTISPECIES: ATP-binding protein [Kribbella]TDW95451.1 histidine kinase/DNA gyrase B/HSP90-like ATPase [Kribbella pratensis]TDX08459.1 histidine kinase/DNA gyrase B/HSP90-like ATPase [Kribbella sp. VKM Ac-2566]